jgi:hypothetical protein
MVATNPFNVILVITGVLLIAATSLAIIAPSIGISTPTAPLFPTLSTPENASGLEIVWADLAFVGGVIYYLCLFIGYMVSMLSVFFQLLGFFPGLAEGITALVVIIFAGSMLMFFRGVGGEGK